MRSPIQHFLIIFDRRTQSISELLEFGTDLDAALAEYGTRERRLEKHSALEVVLVGSDSLETVRKTHANYFGGLQNGSALLEPVIALARA